MAANCHFNRKLIVISMTDIQSCCRVYAFSTFWIRYVGRLHLVQKASAQHVHCTYTQHTRTW